MQQKSKGEKQMDLEKIEDSAAWDFRVFSTQNQIKNRKDNYKKKYIYK